MSFEKFDLPVLVGNKSATKEEIFKRDVATIKNYLVEAGNTWLLVAFRIYEMNVNRSYRYGGYKNIVDCCMSEFGFKKSTVYNYLNIVRRFGNVNGDVSTYRDLFGSAAKFSYSQLCEMFNLSDKQLEQVTPDMSVREIKKIKKSESVSDKSENTTFQTSGKFLEKAPEPSYSSINVFDDKSSGLKGKDIVNISISVSSLRFLVNYLNTCYDCTDYESKQRRKACDFFYNVLLEAALYV